ncbi:hypothetical protein [Methanobacterium spitsbergense]|uniref:hypothetical protein n=1 Tax=Methanobacterium spitsbergense TaxID=2874285 RepID=UPI001CBB17A5|nr:hypothetical protein [Methanobacterium spitsbergense]
MKFYTGLIFIIIGIIGFLMTWIVKDPSNYFSLGAIGFIVIGIWAMFFDSNNPKKKFDNREINYGNNCMKSKYCDMKIFNGYESECKFLKIKIDKNHICDLFKNQILKIKLIYFFWIL